MFLGPVDTQKHAQCHTHIHTYMLHTPTCTHTTYSSIQADYTVAAQTIELYSQMVDTRGKSLVTYIATYLQEEVTVCRL